LPSIWTSFAANSIQNVAAVVIVVSESSQETRLSNTFATDEDTFDQDDVCFSHSRNEMTDVIWKSREN
jgi:hypothetical protein